MSNVNSCLNLFYYSVCLNLFKCFELFTVDQHFSEFCGIHLSVTLSRIHSLHQMNARDFVKLKNTVKNVSYPFIQAEYHVILPCVFTLLVLCLFSKNKKKTIIVLKRQKYQRRNTKSFIAEKKSHWFNLTGWVITFTIILTYRLVAYKFEKNENLNSFSLIKQLSMYEGTKYAEGISQYSLTSTLHII